MTIPINHSHPSDDDATHSELLTISEVAHALRWNPITVRRHIKEGVIPTSALVRLPCTGTRSSYRVKRAWLDRLMAGKITHQEPERLRTVPHMKG